MLRLCFGRILWGAAQGVRGVWSLQSGPDWEVRLWPGRNGRNDAAVPEHGYLYNIPFRDSIADDYFSTRWFVTNWNHRFPDKAVMDVKHWRNMLIRRTAAKVLFEEFADHFTGFIAPFLRHFCPDCLVLGGNIMRGCRFISGTDKSLSWKPRGSE